MNIGRTVFAQQMDVLPTYEFSQCVERYNGNYKVKSFLCWDQFLCMAFAQLTYRESLRDIEACLRVPKTKLYHMGIRGKVSRNTLAHANETRNCQIYADFAQRLISQARKLYSQEDLGIDLSNTVYALDSTTIDLCLSMFPWGPFRMAKAAVNLHRLLDIKGAIPSFIHISDSKWHDVNILDLLIPEPGAFYIMDRGYLDFSRLYSLHQSGSFFVTRPKSNLNARRLYSAPVDRSSGIICDQTILLNGYLSHGHYPENLRRIRFKDADSVKTFIFLTNHTVLPALTICAIYKKRWQIELFFKWIKQHLRIKRFYGTSGNAVITQIWIAVSTYLLIAIIRKRLNLETSDRR